MVDNKTKTVTSFQTLMQLATELAAAERTGDEQKIEEAKRKHDSYKELCLKADSMALGVTNSFLMD